MAKKRKRRRVEVLVRPDIMDTFVAERSPWYETPQDIEAQRRRAKEQAELLNWVRRQIGRKLTRRERWCVRLHYLRGMSYRAVGKRLGVPASTVSRAIQRSLRKLRTAAEAGRPPRRGKQCKR